MTKKTEKFYVLKNVDDEYVDTDYSSGGYPFEVSSLTSARKFSTKEAAHDYAKLFPVHVYQVSCTLKRSRR